MEYFSPTPKKTGWSKLFFCFLFLTIVFANTNTKAQYCTPIYGFGACDEFISNVTIGTINYGSNCSVAQYEDFTSTFTDLFAGLSYPITVSVGPPSYNGDQIAVYVDFNQNSDFTDPGEEFVLTNNGGAVSFSGFVAVPVTATLGITRMRVMMSYNIAPEPCNANSSFYGETEDYTVNIQPGPTCPFSTSLNVTNITTTTADLNWTGDVSATEYKVRYKLTSDLVTVPTWANPTIVTAPTTTLSVSSLTPASEYEFQVSTFCSATDSSGYPFSAMWNTGCFDCPLTSIPEAEACGDDVNGGCNMPVPFFEQINCGDTICGTAWAEVNANFPFGGRDTDWFTFDVTTPGVYTIHAQTMFPAQMGYIGPNSVCPITAFTDYVTSPNECDTLSLTGYLTAGSWIYFISPSVFDGYSCGSGQNNYLTYVCAPNPPAIVSNDICDSATLITQNPTCVPTTGDVAGAFIQTGVACAGTAEDDVWYKFVATTNVVTVQVTGSAGFYPVAEVFDACGGNQLACIQGTGTGGVASQTLAPLTVGQTYYVRVYDIFATVPATTTFDICVFDGPPSTLPNDFCTTAIPVICGDIVTGTTIGALSDIAPTCAGTAVSAPGVWYTFVGDGSNVIFSTCTGTAYDTKMHVYSGDCANLTCVGNNDDFCGLQSQVSFVSTIGVNYYILVNGYNGATGDFTLDVVCLAPCILTCSPTYTAENEVCGADVNGGCNMAVPFFEPIACGDTICGSAWMSAGTRDTDWFSVDITTPGIYTFVAITQFPCTMGYIGPNSVCPITQFDQFVNTPNECDTLSITSLLSAGTWIYAIVPFNPSFDGYPCGSGKNTYVTYVCAPTPPLVVANDICDSAVLLTQNASCIPTTGDVAGAFIQSGPGCTGGSGEDDVWFKFVATPNNPIVQVTGSASFDAVAEVYDACGGNQIACIDATFGGGIESQELSGLTVGQTYYVRVYDYFFTVPATTTFDICVFDAPPPCVVCPSLTALQENEVCGSDANGGCNMTIPFYEPIACGDTVCGTIWADVTPAFPFGGRDTDWYEFTIASPSNVTFTVNSGFTRLVGFIDASLGCPVNNFLAFSDGTIECDTTSVGANLQAGTYWAFVAPDVFSGYPCGGSKSNYTAILVCNAPAPPPANDSCQNAIVVNCGDIVAGSTTYATVDANATFCGTTPEAPGIWYVFAGDGSIATASLCNGPSYDSKINVYSGDCNTLTCVDGNDDFCGVLSQIAFPTVVGTNYYILVNGYNVATGDFQLEITCTPPPPNDDPCGALTLIIGSNGPYDNSSATANPSEPAPPANGCQVNDGWCNSGLENTLWFLFDAPASGRITIQSPGFDTQLAIWEAADCNAILTGGATLIAANDDDADFAAHGGAMFSSYVYSDCLTPGSTYYVQLDGYFGTVGSTDIILADPGSVDASFTTLNSRYCPNASPVLLVPATTGGIFSGPGISGNIFNPSVAGIGGPYDIVYTLLGCITSIQTITVENPVADISPAGPVTVCFGQAVPLTTPYDAGYTYLWKRGPFTMPGVTNNSYTPIWSGTFKYSVKVTDVLGGGCKAKDSVFYTMINFPNPTLIVGPCINNTILLTSSVTDPNLNYQWVKFGTPISGATNSSYTVTSNGSYRIAITDSCGTLRFTPLMQIIVSTCRVEEITEEQVAQMVDVALYPNPNEGQFTIDLNSYDLSSSAVSIDVYNVLGQVVYSKILTLFEGKLNNLIQLPANVEDGLYNVRIKKGNYETYTKIVVSK